MSLRLREFCKRSVITLSVAAFSLSLSAGCAGGPSKKEVSALEVQLQAVESAEKKLAEKKAEKARLERKLAEKRAEKQSLEEKRSATEANLASMTE